MVKVTKKMMVPPTSKMPKMMQRMRSMTAAASFHSFFLSLSLSSALLRILVCRKSYISIGILSVVSKITSCRCWCPSCWNSLTSLFSLLLSTGGEGVDVSDEIFRRRHGASFSLMSHCICSYISKIASDRFLTDLVLCPFNT